MTQEKIKAKPNKKKLIIIISIIVVLLLGAAAFIFFTTMPKGYKTINKKGDILTNETIQVTITEAHTIDHIIGFTMDDKYVYVSVLYTVKNISNENITWKKFPYINIMKYELKGSSYNQIKDSEASFDFNALQSYAMLQGIDYTNVKKDMKAGEIRYDADVIKILKEDFDINKYFITIDNIEAIVQIEDIRTSK